MRKLLLFVMLVTACTKNYAQTIPGGNQPEKDSMELLKDFIELMRGSDKPSSHVIIGIGAGNRLFSIRNNALNAKQSSVNTIIYTPSIGYYHKTGISLSAAANVLNDTATGFGATQYYLSPGYQLQGNDNIAFTFAYTHYFVKNKFSAYASPIQNDLYTFFSYKKTWLQPGIALGYSTGEYKEAKRRRSLYDSVTNSLRSFSVMVSVAHEYLWDKIFTKKDGLFFTPMLLLNSGSNRITIHHNTNATNLLEFLTKKGKLQKFLNKKFEAESAGLSLDASYITGKFIIAPQAYFDYYLPTAETNKLTSVFSLNISYSF